jgi:hypothetical protein
MSAAAPVFSGRLAPVPADVAEAVVNRPGFAGGWWA